jgi:adenine-specific DNA-methyltransferase
MYIEDGVTHLSNFIEQNTETQIKVYVFANGPYPYTEEFESIANNIELAALPDAIYKAYQNILPKQNKEFIPELEEESPVEFDQ